MIEVLSFKLGIDLFDHLKTYKMDLSYVQVYMWKKSTNFYIYKTFHSYDELWNFYYERFAPFDLCETFGDIWAINKFTVESRLDPSYNISFSAYDVSGDNTSVVDNYQYDVNRNNVWNVSKERQKQMVQDVVDSYHTYYLELYELYMHGVYSVCYAEPGWTVHTTRIKSYRDMLFPQEQQQKYSNLVID